MIAKTETEKMTVEFFDNPRDVIRALTAREVHSPSLAILQGTEESVRHHRSAMSGKYPWMGCLSAKQGMEMINGNSCNLKVSSVSAEFRNLKLGVLPLPQPVRELGMTGRRVHMGKFLSGQPRCTWVTKYPITDTKAVTFVINNTIATHQDADLVSQCACALSAVVHEVSKQKYKVRVLVCTAMEYSKRKGGSHNYGMVFEAVRTGVPVDERRLAMLLSPLFGRAVPFSMSSTLPDLDPRVNQYVTPHKYLEKPIEDRYGKDCIHLEMFELCNLMRNAPSRAVEYLRKRMEACDKRFAGNQTPARP